MGKRKASAKPKPRGKSRPTLRKPRRAPEELTVGKRYTSVPALAAEELRKATKLYGSQGRALQVATEMLIRMKRRPMPVSEAVPELTQITYKLLPRTIGLIDELAETVYDGREEVFLACIEVLKLKDL